MGQAKHSSRGGESPKGLRIVLPPEESSDFSLAPTPGAAPRPATIDPDRIPGPGPEPAAEPAPAAPKPQPGLVCRGCGGNHFKVLFTRQHPKRIMRRRQCMNPHCGREITTFERETEA